MNPTAQIGQLQQLEPVRVPGQAEIKKVDHQRQIVDDADSTDVSKADVFSPLR